VEQQAPAPSTAAEIGLPDLGVATILRGGGPRMAAHAGAPVLFFYAGWKLSGLLVGVLLATTVGVGTYLYERYRERPGMVARIALVFVFVQGTIGLIAGSAKVYLAQPVVLNGLLGLTFLVSTLLGRPFAGMFAEEFYPFPPEVRASETFKRAFSRVSLVWAAYLLTRSILRLFMLQYSVDVFVIVNVATGFPIISGLMAWSIWSITRAFRRSEEWGWALTEGEAEVEIAGEPA
jgi:intracellular septation protein A